MTESWKSINMNTKLGLCTSCSRVPRYPSSPYVLMHVYVVMVMDPSSLRRVALGVEVVRDAPGWTVCVVDRDLLRATLDAAGIVETDREI